MALSISVLASTIQSNLSGYGYNGSKMSEFCTAIATGVVNTAKSLTGIGTLTGTTASSGVGIVVSGSNIANTIKSQCISAFGHTGTELQNFCTAIGNAIQTHFALASLASTGNGGCTFPSFSFAIAAMASAIQAAASFTGVKWVDFCTSIATGICNETGSNGVGVLSGSTGGGTSPRPVVIT